MQMETVQTIEAWSIPVFGPSPNLLMPFARANMEMSELIVHCAATVPNPEKVALESADVAICLCRPAAMLGHSIEFRFPLMPERLHARPIVPALSANGHLEMAMARIAVNAPGLSPITPDAVKGYIDLIVDKLHAVCASVNASLGEAVTAKMIVNRARKWRAIGEGIGQHIEEQECTR